ncbi:hypothetical protein NLG97_g6636 [Lecanicillium saksenae]|uniref:Uncharacterized protein n=1 Tax=Lecanicillium saksenae TaxID=468837 RepID=A0ACC1QSW0_9HYPO|nr:hypothetical protein NLG97_g6636 [Lecanicillium saksenae]
MPKLKVALIQLYSKSLDVDGNYARAESFIRSAAAQGAQLAILPEYHLQGWVGDRTALLPCARRSGEFLARYQALARELQMRRARRAAHRQRGLFHRARRRHLRPLPQAQPLAPGEAHPASAGRQRRAAPRRL